jgi:hypothetical protein
MKNRIVGELQERFLQDIFRLTAISKQAKDQAEEW